MRRRLAAIAVCAVAVLFMIVPASALELNDETLPGLPVVSGYKYVTVFDYYGYGAFYHNQDTLTITGNSINVPDAVLYRFSGEVWYLSGDETTWTINTNFCPLLHSGVPVMYDNGTAFYMPPTPDPTQEPTPEPTSEPTPTQTQSPTPNTTPSGMSMFFTGTGYGMAAGTLVWFIGWGVAMVARVFKQITRG